jgi:hypothetical protein
MVKKTAAFRQRRAADTARWRERLRKRAEAELAELYRERAIAHEPPSAIPACRCNEYRPQRGQFASGGRPANLLQRVRTDAMRWP